MNQSSTTAWQAGSENRRECVAYRRQIPGLERVERDEDPVVLGDDVLGAARDHGVEPAPGFGEERDRVRSTPRLTSSRGTLVLEVVDRSTTFTYGMRRADRS